MIFKTLRIPQFAFHRSRLLRTMHFAAHAKLGRAAQIPAQDPKHVLSFSPVVLPVSDRKHNLELRAVFPISGDKLPIVIVSHGAGPYLHLSSLEGFAPLAEFWASRGFVVLQPTHLTSKIYDIQLDETSVREIVLEDRAKDITRVIDRLDDIEKEVPLLAGRLDKSNIALAGHSAGGLTTEIILGATNKDPRNGSSTNLVDKRVKAGLIIGGTGTGGSDIAEAAKKFMGFLDIDFSTMHAPALVVWGERDASPHITPRDAEWHKDPYTLAPGPKTSLMIKDGHHAFGGISGWDASAVQGDENPEMLGFTQRMTLAYLRTQLYGDNSWNEAVEALKGVQELGVVEEKK